MFSQSAGGPTVVAPELDAITYLVSESCPNVSEFVNHPARVPWSIVSFVETRLQSSSSIINSDFIKFNHKNFSRVYPKGSRVESSNYNPFPWWSGGSQLVALNLQTQDKPVWFNEGLFKENGGCGYILKPFYMRSNYNQAFNPVENSPFNPINLQIKIISARQLPKSNFRKKNEICSSFVKVSCSRFYL